MTGAGTSGFNGEDNVDSRATLTRSNGTVTTYTYSSRNWLTGLTNKKSDNTVISSFTYLHDDLDNRARMTENNGDYTTYAYDDTYQLTGQTKRNSSDTMLWQYTYAYDAVGNRQTETDKDSNITTYTYNSGNELTSTNASGTWTTYAYDSNGNLHTTEVAAGTTTYTYDYENRLEVVTYSDDTKATLSYNGEGKRLQKEESGGTKNTSTISGRLFWSGMATTAIWLLILTKAAACSTT